MMTLESDRATPFPPTQWSLVDLVKRGSTTIKRQAQNEILEKYIPAIRLYLRLKGKVRRDDIDDVIQGFITQMVLEKDIIASAQRERGRFRTFLLVALDRHLVSQYRHHNAQKRSPGRPIVALEAVRDRGCRNIDPKHLFDVEWARGIIRQVLVRMRRECKAMGRSDEWEIFKRRLLGPIYGRSKPKYTDIAEELALRSPSQMSKLLAGARKRFIRILHSVVGEYALDHHLVEDEIDDLMRILADVSAGQR